MIKPYYEDYYVQIYHGDSRTVLSELPEKSVDCVMTSPPYYGLRSYKCDPVIWDGVEGCEHEWVAREYLIHNGRGDAQKSGKFSTQENVPDTPASDNTCLRCNAWRGVLGMEPTPQLFIKHLVGIFDLVKRVLKDTGVIFVNLSDSYAGSGNPGGDFRDGKGGDDYLRPYNRGKDIPAKSLIGIPQRFMLSMIDKGWVCRNEVIWFKRSCMPESVKDRFTRDFEHIYFFSKQQDYYFEQQFEPILGDSGWAKQRANGEDTSKYRSGNKWAKPNNLDNPQGRNKRTVWDITSQGSKFDHYASYPPALCETPIKAGCPEYICPVCGKAREKLYEHKNMVIDRSDHAEKSGIRIMSSGTMVEPCEDIFIGYSNCDCKPSTRLEGCIPGVVLDPFMGTGTTLYEAKLLGRRSIGIDVSEEYVRMAVKRLKKLPGVQKGIIGLDAIPPVKSFSRAIPDIDNYSSWVQSDGVTPWVTPETRK